MEKGLKHRLIAAFEKACQKVLSEMETIQQTVRELLQASRALKAAGKSTSVLYVAARCRALLSEYDDISETADFLLHGMKILSAGSMPDFVDDQRCGLGCCECDVLFIIENGERSVVLCCSHRVLSDVLDELEAEIDSFIRHNKMS